ncbi:hypothetical protein MRX96_004800 [Rhipicephalus microplus]
MTSVKSTDLTTITVEPTESMGTSTATSPPASNTSTVTEATTEPVFPAQPLMTPFPVVCVFGTATNESQPLPADGVCDYTSYDGLYDTGPFDTLYSPHFSAPVEHVLSHASLHSVTEYGLSFAYRNASQVARDLEIPEFVNRLEPVWTVKTTRPADIKCEVDQVLSIRPLSSSFKRCVFLSGTRHDFQIYGVFDTEHRDRMTVIQRDTFTRVERLLFLSRDHSCAVIKVESLTDWNEYYYDLRVTDTRDDVSLRWEEFRRANDGIHPQQGDLDEKVEIHEQPPEHGAAKPTERLLKMAPGFMLKLKRVHWTSLG